MRFLKSGGAASLVVVCGLLLALMAQGVTREVPLGGLNGTVSMAENGRALKGATIILRALNPMEGFRSERVFEVTKPDGTFEIRSLPAGSYTIEGYAKAHTLESRQIEIVEGDATDLALELKPHEPYLNVYASQRVFAPEETSQVQLNGFIAADDVSLKIYRVHSSAILNQGGVAAALSPVAYREDGMANLTKIATLVEERTHALSKRDAEGVFMESVALPKLGTGIYWVQANVGSLRKGVSLNVTDLSLVTKHAGGEVLAFVTDIRSGKPISGVSLAASSAGEVAQLGKTGPDGTGRFTLPPKSGSQRVIVASNGPSQAFVELYSSEERDRSNGARLFAYTERPVYRPGDEVLFKGIARQLLGNDYQNMGTQTVEVQLRDPQDSLVDSVSLTSNGMGTFNGSFKINREARTGIYRIQCTLKGATYSHSFSVSAYRKPEYTVSVKSAEPFTPYGGRARAVVECRYFFGGPVVGAKVEAYITREPYWDTSWMDEEWADYYEEEGGGGEYAESVETVTDEQGRAVVEFNTRLAEDTADPESDYSYTVQAYVSEADKAFEGSGKVKVTRGDFGLTIDTNRYVVEPGGSVEATVATLSHVGSKPIAGQEVRIEVGRTDWTGSTSQFRPLSTTTVRTGSDGLAKTTVKAEEGGSLTLRATAVDSGGRSIRESTWLYVDGGAWSGGAQQPGLKLTLDRKGYSIGDTAKVVVSGATPGGSALVTVEGEKVYWSKVVPITSSATVVKFPVTKAMSPNAYVCVAYTRDKAFGETSERVVVSLGTRKLDVQVTSDAKRYAPGGKVTYTIRTRDTDGKPVPAEVSLGVVDESIYAIKEDRMDIVEGFYPKRYNGVSTNYSFAEIYLDGGDKTPANIEVRSKFLDTAYWNPTLRTDASGQATVQVNLPDNLTAWRATATAVSEQTHVGRGTCSVRARKDLMVRLETPQFMVAGDEMQVSAVVVNDTGQTARVQVNLGATGVAFEGDRRETLEVAQGVPSKVVWKVKANQTGQAKLVAKAWIDGGATDGVEAVVPVQPHGRLYAEATAGDLVGKGVLRVEVRPGADRNTGRVRLSLTPSLASTLVGSLDDLIGFPYGCTEQTMSRFMPTVLVAKALADLELPAPHQAALIPEMVREGYARLARMQHSDGSWGWWENDEGDPSMTAYVLEGIARAQGAGYASPIDVERTLEWAKTHLNKGTKPEQRLDNLYLLYAARLHVPKNDSLRAFFTSFRFEGLNPAMLRPVELATGLLAAHAVGDAPEVERWKAALLAKAQRSGSTMHWQEEWYGVEATSRAFAALATVEPGVNYLPSIARYLILSRKGDSWFSTRDTAFALIGMTTYMRASGETLGDFAARVSVNGGPSREIRLSGRDLVSTRHAIEIPFRDLSEGTNRIEVEDLRGKRLYWALDVRQTVQSDQLGAVVGDSGITVKREFFRMEPTRLETGETRLMPSRDPVSSFEAGEPIRVVLTITSQKAQEFMMIEDMLPSNCRVQERGAPGEYEEWTWWFSEQDLRDDRIAFFARNLPAGTQKIEYTMRSEQPGQVRVLPAVVTNMYDPLVRATSPSSQLEVR